MKKRQLAIITISSWLFILTGFMLAVQLFDLEVFFVLWLIGILVIIELTDDRFFQTSHLKKMKYVIAFGILIFGYIIAEKVMVILNS